MRLDGRWVQTQLGRGRGPQKTGEEEEVVVVVVVVLVVVEDRKRKKDGESDDRGRLGRESGVEWFID